MRKAYLSSIVICLFAFGSGAKCLAESIETDWISQQPRSAIGQLDGLIITAATSANSTFDSIIGGRFSGNEWNALRPLSEDAASLVVSDANPGDTHTFVFTEEIDEILFYIENFDSNSVATITAEGASALSLLSNSTSVSFAPTSTNSGILSTSNSESDGEGDLILKLAGNPNSLSLDYTSGDGQNGVFYTFAKAVPEPASHILLCFGMCVLASVRRRCHPRCAGTLR